MGSDNGTKAALPTIPDPKADVKPVILFAIIPAVIGLFVAFSVFTLGATEKYQSRIDQVAAHDLHWGYAALFVLGRAIAIVNMLPIIWKHKILKMDSGNLRSNPFVYTAVGEGASGHHVLFETEGDVGKYNRANRSLHHMIENFGLMLAGLFAVAQVFPFQAFVLACIFGAGRIIHLLGYTEGYGKHAPGFLMSTIAIVSLEGMLGLVALKGWGLA